jgi:cysteine desulfurase family protein
MIYFDNASTSFPKPNEVANEIFNYIQNFGVSPGRGAYPMAEKAAELVTETRALLQSVIGAPRAEDIVFTLGATHSLNIAINGYLKPGDHVLICSWSHNSVIRPIDTLKRKGVITYDVYNIDDNGKISMDAFKSLIKDNTKMVICNHASNVIGVIASIDEITSLCQSRGIKFMLDCTQSLGYVPIDVSRDPIDFLAGTGHKTLLGPSGVGFLYVKDSTTLDPLMVGGSGGNHSTSPYHPIQMPHKFEAGTLNTTCIAGLKGSLEYICSHGFKNIAARSMHLLNYLITTMSGIDEVILYGTLDLNTKVPTLSFNLANKLPSEAAHLYEERGFCLRSGIQCAPLIHKTLRTLPTGTLRISLGHYNTEDEIDLFIAATKNIITEEMYAKTCA